MGTAIQLLSEIENAEDDVDIDRLRQLSEMTLAGLSSTIALEMRLPQTYIVIS